MRPMGSCCRCWMVRQAANARQLRSQAAAAARPLWWAPAGACARTRLPAAAHGRLACPALCGALPSEIRSLLGHNMEAGVAIIDAAYATGFVAPGPREAMNLRSTASLGRERPTPFGGMSQCGESFEDAVVSARSLSSDRIGPGGGLA